MDVSQLTPEQRLDEAIFYAEFVQPDVSETDARELSAQIASLIDVEDVVQAELLKGDRLIDLISKVGQLSTAAGATDEFQEMHGRLLRKAEVEKHDEEFGIGVISVEPARLTEVLYRISEGKNPAIVVRGKNIEDPEEDVLKVVESELGIHRISQEGMVFPKSTSTRENIPIHVDNFEQTAEPQYHYAATVSIVEDGSVLFIGGLARNAHELLKITGYDEVNGVELPRLDPFLDKQLVLEAYVRDMRLRAMKGESVPYAGKIYGDKKPSPKPIKGDMVAVRLDKGDAVIWPQGGRDTVPAWHCFTQIGDKQRHSRAFHLK